MAQMVKIPSSLLHMMKVNRRVRFNGGRVRCTSNKYWLFQEELFNQVPLENLGQYGMEFRTPTTLEMGRKVNLEVDIPAINSLLKFQGQVVSMRRVMNHYAIGVQFTKVESHSMNVLKKII